MITQNDIQRISGTDVYTTDGDKIGSVSQVYLDDRSGAPEWVTVKTGLFGTKESFVPLDRATLKGDDLEVPFGKDQVKAAPRIDADGDLSAAEEDELYRHYGLASTNGHLATDTDTDSIAGRDITADRGSIADRDSSTGRDITADRDTSADRGSIADRGSSTDPGSIADRGSSVDRDGRADHADRNGRADSDNADLGDSTDRDSIAGAPTATTAPTAAAATPPVTR